ncbi:patatin-like phospholipase family protein [Deefgea sp. CFH1-16]|uniref:patatin-like phospholipase family protein n=1 Tax=Deefgea sp. CFH1-16 TaxID=2675457 RepID=UPI0015F6BC5D|nr:patatin-like phospholipase family protein [Deefgea sp. CFH1-16]
MAKTALIISGGAPNATLVAGALEAFHELGLQFDVISTAGAGALLGLMYLAPKNGDPVKTLRGLQEMGIADFFYTALFQSILKSLINPVIWPMAIGK